MALLRLFYERDLSMKQSIGFSEHLFTEEYKKLDKSLQQVYLQIVKAHDFYSGKDKKYRWRVRIIKASVLFISMASTIILGLKSAIDSNVQVNIGLILSSLITFLTALSSYFNLEKYWMRNITKHIELNILRDEFQFDVLSQKLDKQRIDYYTDKLKSIQEDNKKYWNDVLNNI